MSYTNATKSICAGIICLALIACQNAPDCPPSQHRQAGPSAGCLLLNNRQMLVVQGYNGEIGFPGGGSEPGEKAFCTAFRETWEETGLEVVSNKVIKQFDNGFWLYDCELVDQSVVIDPPFVWEVMDAFWLAPEDFNQYTWRFPSQRLWLENRLQGLNP